MLLSFVSISKMLKIVVCLLVKKLREFTNVQNSMYALQCSVIALCIVHPTSKPHLQSAGEVILKRIFSFHFTRLVSSSHLIDQLINRYDLCSIIGWYFEITLLS